MGKRIEADAGHLSSAASDIQRTFPEATVRWDTRSSPYMVTVSMGPALVRAFIEPEVLAQRGDIYDAFTRRVSELMTDSISQAEHHASLDGANGNGKRARSRFN
jgi:hypothetical protein